MKIVKGDQDTKYDKNWEWSYLKVILKVNLKINLKIDLSDLVKKEFNTHTQI